MLWKAIRQSKCMLVTLITTCLIFIWMYPKRGPDITLRKSRHDQSLIGLDDAFVWQPISGENEFVFSAYFDDRFSMPRVRLIGIAHRKRIFYKIPHKYEAMYCHFWYWSDGLLTQQTVQIAECEHIPGKPELKYESVIFTCNLSNSETPFAVTLLPLNFRKVTNRLRIIYSKTKARDMAQFTQCVSPLYHFKDDRQLIEMIEANIIFGVDKFVVYNHTISAPAVADALASYENEGIVEVVPWHVPDTLGRKDVHYFAQRAALNDCLYRRMHMTKYMLATDLDELIVPRDERDHNWREMMNRLDPDHLYDSYKFLNTFFYRQWKDSGPLRKTDSVKHLNITYLLKLKREKHVSPYSKRTKCIWQPQKMRLVEVHQQKHFVTTHSKNVLIVEKENALLHHYRIRFEYKDGAGVEMTDKSILRFADKLIDAIDVRREKLGISSRKRRKVKRKKERN